MLRMLVLAILVCGPRVPVAHAKVCENEPDPAATALMQDVEDAFRARARVFHFVVGARYAEGHVLHERLKDGRTDKRTWGMIESDAEETQILYVFTGPGRMLGTSLLMHDRREANESDSTWLYLKSFESFRALDAKSYRAKIPGTALTYEDARGFVAVDKYHFHWDAPPDPGSARVVACPRSEDIRLALLLDHLLVTVDLEKRLPIRIEYTDTGGRRLKTYEVTGTSRLGDTWVADEIRVEHHQEDYVTLGSYVHWPLTEPLPPDTFVPSVDETSFFARLERVVEQIGETARLTPEIEESARRIEEYERRKAAHEAGNGPRR